MLSEFLNRFCAEKNALSHLISYNFLTLHQGTKISSITCNPPCHYIDFTGINTQCNNSGESFFPPSMKNFPLFSIVVKHIINILQLGTSVENNLSATTCQSTDFTNKKLLCNIAGVKAFLFFLISNNLQFFQWQLNITIH